MIKDISESLGSIPPSHDKQNKGKVRTIKWGTSA